MDSKRHYSVNLEKNKICNKFCEAKVPERKRLFHETFKKYKNVVVNCTRITKCKHHNNYFQENKIIFVKHSRALNK